MSFRREASVADAAERLRAALDAAERHFRATQYGLAFAYYLVAVQTDPSVKAIIKTNFSTAFQIATEDLMKAGRIEDLLRCHAQVCELFPDCDGALNTMGTQLYRMGCTSEAAACFQRALQLNPGLVAAGNNLDNLRTQLVERWHFPMLNDFARNDAFKRAITRAVARGHNAVLDIGAGTGLLSMFAATAGAENVVACEMSKTMCEVARNVLHINDMADTVRVVNKHSTDLKVPDDLPARVSLVVSETFDAGLFGEGILPTLRHAWEHLLLPPDATSSQIVSSVIPSSAVLYACLIESEEIRKQSTLVNASCEGLDLSVLAAGPDCRMPTHGEPYTTARLHQLKGGVRYLSKPQIVAEVCFNDPNDVVRCMEGRKNATHSLQCTVDGRLDAVAAWFDLRLDDGGDDGGGIVISTAPHQSTCWEQAICPLRHSCLDDTTGRPWHIVKTGDVVDVRFTMADGGNCMSLQCEGIARQVDGNDAVQRCQPSPCPCNARLRHRAADTSRLPPGRHGDGTGRFEDSASDIEVGGDVSSRRLPHHSVLPSTRRAVSDDELRLANDVYYLEAFGEALSCTLAKIRQQPTDISCSVLDLSGRFSLLAPLALACGAKRAALCGWAAGAGAGAASCEAAMAVLLAAAAEHLEVPVAAANSAAAACSSVTNGSGSNGSGSNGSDVRSLTYIADVEQCERRSWDVVVVDPVESCGTLRPGVLEDVALACMTCLRDGGLILPYGFAIHAICIDSQQLVEMCRVVDDSRTGGLFVSALINDLQTSVAVDLDLATLPHDRLCADFAAIDVDFRELAEPNRSSLARSSSVKVRICRPGRVAAILYWFELKLIAEHGSVLSTADEPCHWRQAAAVLPRELSVNEGDVLQVTTTIRESCVSFSIP